MKLFDLPKINLLKKSLDVYDKQHQAIAKNIAHANDQGFKRVNTDFSKILTTANNSKIKMKNPKHIALNGGQEKFSIKNQKNSGSVDITKEMGDLAVNQIKFEFSTRVLRRFYEGIGISIRGRL